MKLAGNDRSIYGAYILFSWADILKEAWEREAEAALKEHQQDRDRKKSYLVVHEDGSVDTRALSATDRRGRGVVENTLLKNYYAQLLRTATRLAELDFKDEAVSELVGAPEMGQAREHLEAALSLDPHHHGMSFDRYAVELPEWHDWALKLHSAIDSALGNWLKEKGLPV
ncbi:hypothetical protein JXD38_12670 [candidate division WOR-3 bacterium]|nr:hypothetical protein [candidate division WOR-3 bacterium]